MSKEKQIEEMTNIIGDCQSVSNDDCNKVTCAECKARRVYNAGYRKIPTTDWLTKGVPQEQLEREADEAIKEIFERNCEKYGYRKQSESKWIFHNDGSGTCKNCNTHQMHVWDMDNFQSYCGHCGAKMKGEN